jgi:hypothetical protein
VNRGLAAHTLFRLVAGQKSVSGPGVSIGTLTVTRQVTKSDMFALLMVPRHGGSGRATVSSRTRKEAEHVLVEV